MKSGTSGRHLAVIGTLLVAGALSACETQPPTLSEHEIRVPAADLVIKLGNTPDATWTYLSPGIEAGRFK
jgi:hypothetical protein